MIIGIIGDNIDFLISSVSFLHRPIVGVFTSPELSNILLLLLYRSDKLFLIYNISIIFIACLNAIFIYKFYKHFSAFSFVIPVALTLFVLFSPYSFYRFRDHFLLSNIWIVILFMHYVLFYSKLNRTFNYIYLTLFLLLISLFSNYYGFFSLIFFILFIILKLFIAKIITIRIVSFHFIKNSLMGIICYIIIFVFWLLIFKLLNLGNNNITQTLSLITLSRPLEDFFTFTSRPWYYFLPSIDNPFFGGITKNAIDWLQNDWGYFLTNNYFPTEHSASYLGWVNFIFALFGFRYIWRKVSIQKSHKVWTREMDVLTLGFVAIFLVIITMPPFFTISGLKIYMPSFLLWKLFPMFRVLARLGIIILLIELVFTGYGYVTFLDFIKLKISSSKLRIKRFLLKKWGVVSFFIILPFFILSLMEFYVPIYFTDVNTAPSVFTYVKNNTPTNAVLVTYPVNKAGDTFFWIREYKRALINPPGYNKPEDGYNFLDFTSNLITCKGILEARNLGATYLVYYYKADKTPDVSFKFFDNTNLLIKEKKFDYSNPDMKDLGWLNTYIKIIDMGNVIDNSAILYRINDKIDYESEKEKCLSNLPIVK